MEKGKADRGPGITARLWDSSLIQNSASESLQIGQRSEMKGSITMKKLMIAASAALCATVGFGELASANIVGYTSKTLEPNTWYLVANNFVSVGDGEQMNVQDFFSGLTATDDPMTAPMIQYWNGTKLETIYYMNYLWDVENEEEVEVGWGNGDYEVVNWQMAPGAASWLIVRSGTPTVTCAGQVVSLTEKSLALSTNWQLLGSPYPTSFTLNGAGVDCSGLVGTDDPMTAPLMQYWNGTKLETAYYMNYLWDVEAEEEVATGWGNGDYETVNRTFSPCEGFWVKLQNATPGEIKFTR